MTRKRPAKPPAVVSRATVQLTAQEVHALLLVLDAVTGDRALDAFLEHAVRPKRPGAHKYDARAKLYPDEAVELLAKLRAAIQ